MSFHLDKSTWKRVAFGDVIENIAVRVDDPSAAGVDRYVGLEHLDPGVMTVQRWDSPDRVEAQKLRFQPGDVIFGRRRAYQKKVARADFEGICSAHALVLRARSDVMRPDFLSVFLSSDYFLDRAISISVGSLSPTVNWRDLKIQEFLLPTDFDEQQRIADLLWSVERQRHDRRQERLCLERVVSQYCMETFQHVTQAYPLTSFDKAGQLLMGRQKAPKYMTGVGSTPYLRVANIGSLELNLSRVEEMDFNERDLARFNLKPGDVLLTEGDIVTALNVGRPAVYNGELGDCAFQNTLIRFRPQSGANPMFYVALFEGMRLSGVFAGAASTTTVTHLGLGRLAAVSIPDVPFTDQDRLGNGLRSLLGVRAAMSTAGNSLSVVRSRLLAEIFGGAE